MSRLRWLALQVNSTAGRSAYELASTPELADEAGLSAEATTEDLRPFHKMLADKGSEGARHQKALLWAAILLSRRYFDREDRKATRAVLESTLCRLVDPGHRDIARSELAVAATRCGDFDAAASWLSECQPSPRILEVDSAIRYARALLTLRVEGWRAADELINPPEDVPVAQSYEVPIDLLRAECQLLRGQPEGAGGILEAYRFDRRDQMLDVSRRDAFKIHAMAQEIVQAADAPARREQLQGAINANFALEFARSPWRPLMIAGWGSLALGIVLQVVGRTFFEVARGPTWAIVTLCLAVPLLLLVKVVDHVRAESREFRSQALRAEIDQRLRLGSKRKVQFKPGASLLMFGAPALLPLVLAALSLWMP